MHYQISRNGQTYGPYTLDDLQRYLATGNVLPGDLAKSDDMPEWISVSQLLATPPAASIPPAAAPTGYAQPAYIAPTAQPVTANPALANSTYDDAPNLNYGLVILFSVLTCGLFTVVWDIVIAVWLRRVQPSDQSLFWYLASLGARVLGWFIGIFIVGNAFAHGADASRFGNAHLYGAPNLSSFVSLVVAGLLITANFVKRASLEQHFNGPEPVGLQLSGVMTFFFAPFYFQYHLNRINELKQAARYGTPRAF